MQTVSRSASYDQSITVMQMVPVRAMFPIHVLSEDVQLV
jgi:hypothetical protein